MVVLVVPGMLLLLRRRVRRCRLQVRGRRGRRVVRVPRVAVRVLLLLLLRRRRRRAGARGVRRVAAGAVALHGGLATRRDAVARECGGFLRRRFWERGRRGRGRRERAKGAACASRPLRRRWLCLAIFVVCWGVRAAVGSFPVFSLSPAALCLPPPPASAAPVLPSLCTLAACTATTLGQSMIILLKLPTFPEIWLEVSQHFVAKLTETSGNFQLSHWGPRRWAYFAVLSNLPACETRSAGRLRRTDNTPTKAMGSLAIQRMPLLSKNRPFCSLSSAFPSPSKFIASTFLYGAQNFSTSAYECKEDHLLELIMLLQKYRKERVWHRHESIVI